MPISPIQYLPQAPNPFDVAVRGLQIGNAIRNVRAQSAEEERVRQEQEAIAQRKEQYSMDLESTFNDPTPANIAKLTLKYPGQKEAFKQGFGVLSEEQKKNEILKTGQVYSALSNGNIDAAKSIIDEQITATANAGGDTKKLESIKNYIDKDPQGAAGYTGLVLSSVMGEKDFAKTFETVGKERRAAELQPGKVDIQSEDIETKKLDRQIKVAETAIKKADSETKRQEIQSRIDDLSKKREEIVNKTKADISGARLSIDNLLNTADKILNTPMSTIEAAAGPISTMTPTFSAETADLEELFSTLDAQAFIAQIPTMTGKGALSDSEGKKLSASLQNLSLRQSPKRLVENVKEVQRLMLKARKNLATKYGEPETTPDTPAAELSSPEIDALLQKYGG